MKKALYFIAFIVLAPFVYLVAKYTKEYFYGDGPRYEMRKL